MKIREKLIIGVNLILFIIFFLILLLNKAYIGKLYLKMKTIQLKKVVKKIDRGEVLSEIEKEYEVKIIRIQELSNKNSRELRERAKNHNAPPMDGMLKRAVRDISNKSMNQIDRGRIIVEILQNRGRQPEAIILLFKARNNEKMAVLSPITKIGEVIEILTYYSYFLLIMCLLASGIVLSIFSYGIAKPLIKIKGVANKMANLDFSEKINIKTGDEVEELGESINNLSIQLETNIERLKDDIKEKEKANEIQRRFFSTVSHELKTPLAIIQGYASGLRDNVAPEKVDFYCEVINDEVQEMSKLITTLLNKMKYENETTEKEKFNLMELLSEIIQKYKIDIEEKKVELNIDADSNLEIDGDKDGIKTVMLNFITNAVSFVSDSGEINIDIKNSGEKIKFSIFNTGENIPEEKINDIWKPFYRIEASQNRKYGGSGLGLSIVKDILEKHDAEYGAFNLNNGVEFYFII